MGESTGGARICTASRCCTRATVSCLSERRTGSRAARADRGSTSPDRYTETPLARLSIAPSHLVTAGLLLHGMPWIGCNAPLSTLNDLHSHTRLAHATHTRHRHCMVCMRSECSSTAHCDWPSHSVSSVLHVVPVVAGGCCRLTGCREVFREGDWPVCGGVVRVHDGRLQGTARAAGGADHEVAEKVSISRALY